MSVTVVAALVGFCLSVSVIVLGATGCLERLPPLAFGVIGGGLVWSILTLGRDILRLP